MELLVNVQSVQACPVEPIQIAVSSPSTQLQTRSYSIRRLNDCLI